MNDTVIIGPYLCSQQVPPLCHPSLADLAIAIEWATTDNATTARLYHCRPLHGGDRIRLENLLVNSRSLPFSCELCNESAKSPGETSIPLDSLIYELYRRYRVCRPIFGLLRELADAISVHATVSHPLNRQGVLLPEAEERGFRLNTIIPDSALVHIDLAWEPGRQNTAFHAGVCTFRMTAKGQLDHGEWRRPLLLGTAALLQSEILRLVGTRSPWDLLTPLGRQLIHQPLER